MQAFQPSPPPFARDSHGVIRVGGTRISLESVVVAFDQGASAEEIVDRFPTLDLAAAYAAIAYVLDHRAEVDAYLVNRKTEFSKVLDGVEQRFPAHGLRAQLLARGRSAG